MTNKKNNQKKQPSRKQIIALKKQLSTLSVGKPSKIRGRGSYSISGGASNTGNHYSLLGNAFSGNQLSIPFTGPTLFGSGKYSLKGGNSCWDSSSQVPVMHSGKESIRFCHREYLGQVSSSTAFTIQYNEQINPTNTVLFPYLSSMANNFQEYRFKGLAFYFKSTSADALNSTNTALGTVIMTAHYRADAPAPTNKVAMLNEMWSIDGRPSADIAMPVECAPQECPLNILYCGDGSLGTNDPKFYNLAQFYLATQGSQAVADIGELYVTYDIELYKPILALSTGPFSSNCARYSCISATTADPKGAQVSKVDSGLPFTVTSTAGIFILTLVSPGLGSVFLVNLTAVSATSGTIAFNAIANATLSQTYLANTANAMSVTALAVTPFCSGISCIVVSDAAAGTNVAIQFSCTYVGTTQSDLYVSQIAPHIVGL